MDKEVGRLRVFSESPLVLSFDSLCQCWVGRISKYFSRFSFLKNSSFITQLVPREADRLVPPVAKACCKVPL